MDALRRRTVLAKSQEEELKMEELEVLRRRRGRWRVSRLTQEVG